MIADRLQGGFTGSIIYAPISANRLRSISMKDDLESLGYTILSLLVRHQGLWFKQMQGDHALYIHEKLSFIESTDLNPRLKGIQSYLQAVRKL